jgi:hypothetical protein
MRWGRRCGPRWGRRTDPKTLRWAVGSKGRRLGLWRLRPWLAPMAPGGCGSTVRPYYEGLPIDRLDEDRTNGGESCRDQGEQKLPVRSRKNGPADRNRHGRASRGAPAGVKKSAGDLRRISGDLPDREAGHRCGASAPAPVGALPPSFFRGRTEGAPGAFQRIRGAERWLGGRMEMPG